MLETESQRKFLDDWHRIEKLHRHWLVGTNEISVDQMPNAWRPILEGQSPDKASLLALTLISQHRLFFCETLFQPATLQLKPLLPELSLPTLSEISRPLFRRLLEVLQKQRRVNVIHLLNLLLSRDLVAHPADWLPAPSDQDLASVYWPWSRWVANELSNEHDAEAVTEENWDELYPAERLALLKRMRLQSPDTARELISQCAPREPAEKRIKIIEILKTNLNENDVDYLRSLLSDRSQKIVSFAQQSLSRLGKVHSTPDSDQMDLAKELAETLEVKISGLIMKRTKVLTKSLKSTKQQALRTEWLEKVSLIQLSEYMAITIEKLAGAWSFSDIRASDNHSFVVNAVNNLSDAAIDALLENLLGTAGDKEILQLLSFILPRLDEPRRISVVLDLLASRSAKLSFFDCLMFIDKPLVELGLAQLKDTLAWKALNSKVGAQIKNGVYLEDTNVQDELLALGLMLPRAAAQSVLDSLLADGLLLADPALDALKLNIQLVTTTSSNLPNNPND